MRVAFGKGTTVYGPGVDVTLSDNEVALAITAYLVARGIHISGPRTILLNGELCKKGRAYVDPSGFVMAKGKRYNGKGTIDD